MRKKLLLFLFLGGFAFHSSVLAAPCRVSDPKEFQDLWGQLERGGCETSSKHLFSFSRSMTIFLKRSLVLNQKGNPIEVVAIEGAKVILDGSEMEGEEPALKISRSNVSIQNLVWQNFPATVFYLTGNEISLKQNEIKGGKVGVLITDENHPTSCLQTTRVDRARHISLRDNEIHHHATYGVMIDGFQVRIGGSGPESASIHDNGEAGIYFKSESAPYHCALEKKNLDPIEWLHSYSLSNVSFYGNGPEELGQGILTEGPVFPAPTALVLSEMEDDEEKIILSGFLPLSSDPNDPWRLGRISPRNIQIEIYETSEEEQNQGERLLAVVKKVNDDGSFKIEIEKEDLSSSEPALTAIATDVVLGVSSSFSPSYLQGPKADSDQDGLSNIEEDRNNNARLDLGESDPQDPDTDGDGARDGLESEWNLDPQDVDTDGDCLPDGLELGVSKEEFESLRRVRKASYLTFQATCLQRVKEMPLPENGIWKEEEEEKSWENLVGLFDLDPSTKTDPTQKDSDQDGIEDGMEDGNLTGRVEEPESDASKKDSDGDELADGEELSLKTDPVHPDTDGDGAQDGAEVKHYFSDPLVCDTDRDGLGDGLEAGVVHPNANLAECRGLQEIGTNFGGTQPLRPTESDSDRDGIADGEEDANQNGWLDVDETDPTESDTDGDGLEDGFENQLGSGKGEIPFDLSLLKNGEKCSPPADKRDIDCDGFLNARDQDSDEDGCFDQEEGRSDRNENGILDLWETSVKMCGATSSSSGASHSPSGVSPAVGTTPTTEPTKTQKNIAFDERLSVRGGGACSLVIRNPNLVKDSLGAKPLLSWVSSLNWLVPMTLVLGVLQALRLLFSSPLLLRLFSSR